MKKDYIRAIHELGWAKPEWTYDSHKMAYRLSTSHRKYSPKGSVIVVDRQNWDPQTKHAAEQCMYNHVLKHRRK